MPGLAELHNLGLLRLWSEVGCVVDVQDFDLVCGDPIKDAEGVADQRDRADALGARDVGGAFRPGPDVTQAGLEAALKGWEGRGVMGGGVGADGVEVAEGFGGEDDFHAPRKRAKTAATSSSVAKRPARASARPRSILANSASVGWYSPSARAAWSSGGAEGRAGGIMAF